MSKISKNGSVLTASCVAAVAAFGLIPSAFAGEGQSSGACCAVNSAAPVEAAQASENAESGLVRQASIGGTIPSTRSGAAATAAPLASGDIVEIAVGAGQFNTLAKALQAAGLVETLKGDGPFTVFAPTDDAFAALPAGALEGLLADREALRDVLLYHFVAGRKVEASSVVRLNGQEVETASGDSIRVTVEGGNVSLNDDVAVTRTDVQASNGVIHVIDAVLMPS